MLGEIGITVNKVSDYSLESAICKVYASETLWRVVNETLQIAAGIGYMRSVGATRSR